MSDPISFLNVHLSEEMDHLVILKALNLWCRNHRLQSEYIFLASVEMAIREAPDAKMNMLSLKHFLKYTRSRRIMNCKVKIDKVHGFVVLEWEVARGATKATIELIFTDDKEVVYSIRRHHSFMSGVLSIQPEASSKEIDLLFTVLET